MGSKEFEWKRMFLLVIPVSTFCLGTWQIYRLQLKVGQISDLEEKTKKPPSELPHDIKDRVQEMEYRRVFFHGQFDHEREMKVYNRSQINENFNSATGGFQIVTPFKCKETGSYILVNRGWVPRNRILANTRQKGQIEGEHEVTGIVRTSEKQSTFTLANKPEENRWFWKDIAGMAEYAGTDPVMIDADGTTTVPGGPIGGQTKVALRNNHMEYIFTWYTIALATGYMFYRFLKKR